METYYQVTYIIRKENGKRALLTSPRFYTVDDARVLYEAKLKKENVVGARLQLVEHYEQCELLADVAYTSPYGRDYIKDLAIYDRI